MVSSTSQETVEEGGRGAAGLGEASVGDPDLFDDAVAGLEHPAALAVGREVPRIEPDLERRADTQPRHDRRDPLTDSNPIKRVEPPRGEDQNRAAPHAGAL